MPPSFEQYSSGKRFYGDDFSSDQIGDWFRSDEEAYYKLSEESVPGAYAFHARNWRHGFRHLPCMSFEHVLCLGGAYGDELRPILGRAKRVTILEPAGGFQNPKFEYVKPEISGRMPFANDSFDLITCFGVLHHFPNVSAVVSEMARCTKPLGWNLICEPTHSMSNWERPPRLMTPRERGIPPTILRKIVGDAGLQIVRQRRCMFSLTSRFQLLLPKRMYVFNTKWVTLVDDYVSNLPWWSERYHAANLFQKLRPWALFLVLRKSLKASMAC